MAAKNDKFLAVRVKKQKNLFFQERGEDNKKGGAPRSYSAVPALVSLGIPQLAP